EIIERRLAILVAPLIDRGDEREADIGITVGGRSAAAVAAGETGTTDVPAHEAVGVEVFLHERVEPVELLLIGEVRSEHHAVTHPLVHRRSLRAPELDAVRPVAAIRL